MRLLVLVLLLLLVGGISYVLQNTDIEKSRPASINVVVDSSVYSVGDTESENLVELVETFTALRGEDAQIVLYATENISYVRVKNSIEVLKQNGFHEVSLGANE